MKTLLITALAILLTGCATSYKPVDREALPYKTSSLSPEIDFAFSRSTLRNSPNPRYVRKAIATRTDIVAVKLRNRTDHPLSVQDDLTFFSGSTIVQPAQASTAIRDVRQSPGMYFLYFLMAPANIYGSSSSCDYDGCRDDFFFLPVGLVIGPVLTAINAAVASSANGNFRKDIQSQDLWDKTLAPGDSASGYLVFPNSNMKTLTAKLKTSSALPPPTPPDPFEGYDAPPARARDFH